MCETYQWKRTIGLKKLCNDSKSDKYLNFTNKIQIKFIKRNVSVLLNMNVCMYVCVMKTDISKLKKTFLYLGANVLQLDKTSKESSKILQVSDGKFLQKYMNI